MAQRQEQAAALRAENAALARDNKWLAESDQKLRDTFQSLAAEALKDNRSSFLDLAKTSFEQYQQPIADTLKKVDLRLGEAERDRVAAYSKLAEQVTALGSTANTLSRALRTPAVRGRWGEMQLRRVVEIAGMLQRCDFDEQPALLSDNGRLRPDLDRPPPRAASRSSSTRRRRSRRFSTRRRRQDEDVRAARLQAHARQVRDHMDKLGSKAYWDQLGNSPEMVVMFLPGRNALQRGAAARPDAHRARPAAEGPARQPDHAHRAADDGRALVAAGGADRELPGGGAAREGILRAAGDVRRALRRRAQEARRRGAGLQQGRRLVRDARARERPPAQGPGRHDGRRAARRWSPIDTVPRVLKQAGLMGLPETATLDEEELDSHLPT